MQQWTQLIHTRWKLPIPNVNKRHCKSFSSLGLFIYLFSPFIVEPLGWTNGTGVCVFFSNRGHYHLIYTRNTRGSENNGRIFISWGVLRDHTFCRHNFRAFGCTMTKIDKWRAYYVKDNQATILRFNPRIMNSRCELQVRLSLQLIRMSQDKP